MTRWERRRRGRGVDAREWRRAAKQSNSYDWPLGRWAREDVRRDRASV